MDDRAIVTRKQALALGLKTYFTAVPCKNGHVCERSTERSACYECNKERGIKFRESNKEHLSQYFKEYATKHKSKISERYKKWARANAKRLKDYLAAYYQADKEHFKEQSREWRKNNPERLLAITREWRKNNPERYKSMHKKWKDSHREIMRAFRKKWEIANPMMVKAKDHRHKARKRKAVGSYSGADLTRIYDLQRGRCAYCAEELNGKFQIDHITSLAKGGSNYARNIQLLCSKKKNGCNQLKGRRDPIEFAQSLGMML